VFPEDAACNGSGNPNDPYLYPDLDPDADGKKASRALKRSIDVAGSLCALIFAAPLLLIIAAAIKLTSRGPVLFCQQRVGQHGRWFTFLKFRSMHSSCDPAVHQEYVTSLITEDIAAEKTEDGRPRVFKLTNDPRITPLGRFLRKSSLDEWPQFFNVLKGDMSLVGPRPAIPYEVECYSAWHRQRVLAVKPGITGLWQITGRSRMPFSDMVRLDLRYARTWSPWLDLKILLQTPRAVILGDGAY
jgi:lipopolysaccharide/colanic/teichoic acid biosynthesis glycosyltransferase